MRRICHHVVFTPEIGQEWRDHRSRYFSDWIRSMYSRKKVTELGPIKSDELRRAIERSSMSPTDKEIVEKDAFIINAALASDRIILTQDRELNRTMMKYPRLGRISMRIRWINPENDGASELDNI
jgi:predicted nuclease of predicted toxin-antitoxin system